MRDVAVIVLAVTILIAIVSIMYYSLSWARRSERRARRAIGRALQELDRHTARPSIENQLEHEAAVVYVEDERGGE